MVKPNYIPERGDFVMLNFNPQKGHEQSGHRPAIVISHRAYNAKTGLCLACPITNSIKGYPFEVACLSEKISGVILSDQVKNLDWKAREVSFKAKAKHEVMEELIGKLSTLIS